MTIQRWDALDQNTRCEAEKASTHCRSLLSHRRPWIKNSEIVFYVKGLEVCETIKERLDQLSASPHARTGQWLRHRFFFFPTVTAAAIIITHRPIPSAYLALNQCPMIAVTILHIEKEPQTVSKAVCSSQGNRILQPSSMKKSTELFKYALHFLYSWCWCLNGDLLKLTTLQTPFLSSLQETTSG